MSVVLLDTPAYRNPLLFWTNRCLRLFPTYWVILLLSTGLLLTAHVAGANPKVSQFLELSAGTQGFLVAANIILLGQDLACFLQEKSGIGMAFTADFRQVENPLIRFLAVPQAWSLALELTFYLLIPFIVNRPRTMILLFSTSLALRGLAIHQGFGSQDPWSYRFFPFELALFLLGVFAHQWVAPATQKWLRDSPNAPVAALAICVTALIFYPTLNVAEVVKQIIMLCLFFVALPLLFQLSSHSRFDRRIGELSYPIYLAHLLILIPLRPVSQRHPIFAICLAIVLTVLLAVIINKSVDPWIGRYRARVRMRSPS